MSSQPGLIDTLLPPAIKGKYAVRSVVFVLMLSLSLFIYYTANQQYFVMSEQLSTFKDNPGDQVPWYFIRRDFVKGICYSVALLVTLVIAIGIAPWFPESSLMFAFFGLIWLGSGVWQAAVIQANCQDLMNPVKATTRWQTFDQFLHDPMIMYPPFILPFVLLIVLFYPLSPILKRLDYRKGSSSERNHDTRIAEKT